MSAERKGTGTRKKQDNRKGNTLYTFSAHATVYENADGSLKGVIVSGYTNSGGDGREYCNLWIPGALVRVGKCKDGAPMLSIKMAAIAPPKQRQYDDANDYEADF